MPPGKPESEAPDADDADDLVTADAAEAAAAAAEARAEAARARANELRRKLDAATPAPTDSDVADSDGPEDGAATADEVAAPKRRLRPPSLKAVAATVAVLAIAGLSGGTGYLVWQHRKAESERHHTAEYSAAARQGVVNLMSMDYTKAKESVQRIIDDSTGKFKSNMEDSADDLVKALQDSKMSTKVTVNDAAVESMDADTAVVLVAATSHREGPDAPKEDQQPRVWRVVITLEHDNGQIKVSDVEFV
ncbi:hypothetical protein B1R94_08285 [Mycolicibacterium litorale]|nr:hypothetical protein B1R94_08285 [Mycolicibacterium litorale]